MNKVKVQIELPQVLAVGDYHQFAEIRDMLRLLGVKGAKVHEIGSGSEYYGVLYVGQRPSKREQMDLIAARFGKQAVRELTEDDVWR